MVPTMVDPTLPPAPPPDRAAADRAPDAPPREAASFGFRTVAAEEKAPLVQGVFTSVAARYDVMNDLMSVGIHRLWKNTFVDLVAPRPHETILDVAGGTGDIAFRLAARAPGARIVVCDLTEAMVRVGRDRGIDQGMLPGRRAAAGASQIDWTVGNAESLPLADASVDAYTIAFGLRNVTRIDLALAEARRVLKPGGRFFCLEFSQVDLPGLKQIYDRYSFDVLPRLGSMVAGDRDSYQYLVESIRKFPTRQALCQRMEAVGLRHTRARALSGGIAAIHSGWRV